MNWFADNAHLVTGLLTAGLGAIVYWTDRDNALSRPLALCLAAIGVAVLLDETRIGGWLPTVMLESVRALAILAGVEWGRRIGNTASGRARAAANGLFRAAQILVLVYWGLSLGYVVLFTDAASTDAPGLIRTRPLEFAVFAPVLGSAMLCAAIAILLLLAVRIDRAEAVRLRVLFFAAPFLLAALVVGETLVPITIALGLLVVIYGSMRYLIIQTERGRLMGRFLSPEVERLVRTEGMDRVLRLRRRPVSIVVCDLRRFTAFARANDSETVAATLERFYAAVGAVAAEHGGTVKDHAGDGVLVLVGAPLSVTDHAAVAAALAVDLTARVREALAEVAPDLGLGVGIATGTVTVGAMRGAGQLEYMAVGNAVNLAARLCDRAEDGEILIDDRTRAAVADRGHAIEARPPERLKGFDEPVPVFALRRF
ncbi:adenylate/guanylate cyclase [Salinisphaera sp. PC39]|uniref:adenylate/guanylate cyclase domain-containing protein n=1 Tax=Salinisphaera sp. PC39 TaxID=1304156 RepID=UPI00333FDE5D